MKLLLGPLFLLACVLCSNIGSAGSKLTPRAGQRLDSMLSSYESLTLDPVDESAVLDPPPAAEGRLPVHLRIEALNRTFALHLRRGEPVFEPGAKVIVHGRGRTVELDVEALRTNSVRGFLLGEPRSSVRGHVHDGAFFGVMATPDASYFVEPAATYFSDAGRLDAIVYEEGAVHWTMTPTAFCYGDPRGEGGTPNDTPAGRQQGGGGGGARGPQGQTVKIGKACKVKVVSDHYFFSTYSGSSLRRTVSNMEFHVGEADQMFRTTDFDGNGAADDVRIRASSAEVFQSPSEANYILGDSRLNASSYLELFSLYGHDGVCGAMAFSQRPFDKDVLGFAYRGSPERPGGICSRRAPVEGKERSLNVGMTTFDYRGTTIPRARSAVVFTHELGHMFGSTHDEDAEGGACFVDQEAGHYIMSAVANSGTTGTNRKFSPCSARLMRRNMEAHGQCLHCRGSECDGAGRPEVRPVVIAVAAVVWIAAGRREA